MKKRPKPRSDKKRKSGLRLDKRAALASYYGFTSREVKPIPTENLFKLKKMLALDSKKDSEIMMAFDTAVNLDEKLILINEFVSRGENPFQPVMVFYYKHKNEHKSSKYVNCGLEIIGTTKSIAEATLIKTSLELLKNEGYKNLTIDINSIGDKDSLVRLIRELTNYYRKHISDLPAPCRHLLKKDVFEVLLYPDEKCLLLREDAPKPMNYLSELSQQHFREVLEFLERMDIPYQIISSLVGNKKYVNHVVFEIRCGEAGDPKSEILARGFRYNGIAKKIGSRKEIPAVGVALSFKAQPLHHGNRKISMKKCKVYFIQLGFEAKSKSLKVIETLSKEKIPLQQSLSKDKLSAQLSAAEHMKIPYVLIMGQKEAMEDSVIVRNMTTRSQNTVSIRELSAYLKKLI